MPVVPGQNLGSYRIVEQIGRGGMATVFKAFQPALSRHVAIKVLPAMYAEESTFLDRFHREAVLIAGLRHPNILTVFDSGEQDGTTYIVSELIEGGTLADLLKGALPLDQCIRLLKPVASALDYAHTRGVIHRDVKPSNVLMAEDGTPILSDFGIARMIETDARLTQTGVGIGTPEYMAPEQAMGHTVGPAVDTYALGVVAYQMLTGSVPFASSTPLAVAVAHVRDPLPLPRERNPSISVAVQDVLLKALAKDPAHRYAAPSEMIAALEAAAAKQEEPTVIRPVSVAPPATVAPLRSADPPATVAPSASVGPATTLAQRLSQTESRSSASAAATSAAPMDTASRGARGSLGKLPLIVGGGVVAIAVVAVGAAGLLARGAPEERSDPREPQLIVVTAVATPAAPAAVCQVASAIVASADVALREGALDRSAELLGSVSDCPNVDVLTRQRGTDTLMAAAAAEASGGAMGALAELQQLREDDPSFPGLAGPLSRALVAAGRAALDADEPEAALALCREAQAISPEQGDAARCIVDALPPTPTPLPEPTDTPRPVPATARPQPTPLPQPALQPAVQPERPTATIRPPQAPAATATLRPLQGALP
ncbi:MAG: Protein kinase protein [Chloroflexi bacterium]|nr:Protein kinase protein [Chloroflexota bacterium]